MRIERIILVMVLFIGVWLGLGGEQARADLLGPYDGPSNNDNETIMSSLLGEPVIKLDEDEFDDGMPAFDLGPPLIVELINDYEAQVSWDLTGTGEEAWAVAVKDGGNIANPPVWVWYEVTTDQRIVGGGLVDTYETENEGAISHINLYGKRVPEPAAILLIGVGLIGVAVVGRRVSKKT